MEFEAGDRVWVRNLPHEGDKLDPLWSGPAEVLERVGLRGRYKVALGGSVIDVHADRLKMYLPHVYGTKIVLNYYRPHREVPEDDSNVVESILRHRVRDNTSGMSDGKDMMIASTHGSQQVPLLDMSNRTG